MSKNSGATLNDAATITAMTNPLTFTEVAEWFVAYNAAALALFGIADGIVTPEQDAACCKAATAAVAK